MTQIIKYKKTVNSDVILTSFDRYLSARREAEDYVKKNDGFMIASMPNLISVLANKKNRSEIRSERADVNSAEYHGQYRNNKVYVVCHGMGPLASIATLMREWYGVKDYGFMPIEHQRWVNMLSNIHMLKLNDIKGNKSFNPEELKCFGIYADAAEIELTDSKYISIEKFMKSDRALMIAGSEKKREQMTEILKKEDLISIRNNHRLYDADYSIPKGRPLFLDMTCNGLGGNEKSDAKARFVMMARDTNGVVDVNKDSLEKTILFASGKPFSTNRREYQSGDRFYHASRNELF